VAGKARGCEPTRATPTRASDHRGTRAAYGERRAKRRQRDAFAPRVRDAVRGRGGGPAENQGEGIGDMPAQGWTLVASVRYPREETRRERGRVRRRAGDARARHARQGQGDDGAGEGGAAGTAGVGG